MVGYTQIKYSSIVATAIANLVNIPGWTITSPSSAVVLMIATSPGYSVMPTFQAGAGVVCTLSSTTFQQGFTLNGYTSSYSAGATAWVGPSPYFTPLAPPSGTTYATVYTVAGSTGSNLIYGDIVNNPGAQPPTFSTVTVPTSQTTTQLLLPADLNYYLNFSNPAMHGNVNVTAIMLKYN